MIKAIDLQNPVSKSHDWLYIDSMGVWRVFREFDTARNRALWAIWNGERLFIHDAGNVLHIYDPATDTTTDVSLVGNARADMTAYNGDVILLDYNANLYRIDQNGTIVWQISLSDVVGTTIYGYRHKILVQDGVLWVSAYYGNDRYIFKIDPATGTVQAWNKANIAYISFTVPYRVGDYLVLSSDRPAYGAVFDLNLNLLGGVSNYPDTIPWTYIAKILRVQDGYMYYLDEVLPYLATDGRLYGEVYKAQIDDANNALWFWHEIPSLRPANNQDTYWRASNVWEDELLAMRGIDASGDYMTIWIPWNGSHWGPARWGYAPLGQEIAMTYAFHASNTVQRIIVNTQLIPVVNIKNRAVEMFKTFKIYLSKDQQNWTEVKSGEDITAQGWKGDIYLKIVWNWESFDFPVLKDLSVVVSDQYQNIRTIQKEKYTIRKE